MKKIQESNSGSENVLKMVILADKISQPDATWVRHRAHRRSQKMLKILRCGVAASRAPVQRTVIRGLAGTAGGKKVAVVFSGCGVFDGTEATEVRFTPFTSRHDNRIWGLR